MCSKPWNKTNQVCLFLLQVQRWDWTRRVYWCWMPRLLHLSFIVWDGLDTIYFLNGWNTFWQIWRVLVRYVAGILKWGFSASEFANTSLSFLKKKYITSYTVLGSVIINSLKCYLKKTFCEFGTSILALNMAFLTQYVLTRAAQFI